ncbi:MULTISPECIES: ABC transporter substrate-binding protein [Cedecea]|uniref:Peptide ABC transporter substrate-binding protein n=1 Tax=Cedecea neteri TaxID=158822 RepID=A0AAN0S392_9ENTR|nr:MULTISPECIES: ABC transporter substrate-binding protein [Cedecea]AIR60711.1 peptide ABC transporter substrate-binding protein [Cedecea neteri]NIG76963.1 ABC transporter substrate-binding protein [Klebsiella sp. Ap-873]SMG47509.1 peptide/nickel transport system substrate-binding protein [Cedecea sp. NFIX57]
MKDDRSDEKKYLQGVSMSRRSFINTAALIGMGSALSLSPLAGFAAEATPKKGGVLKLGMSGGNTSDSLDPTLFSDWVPLNQAYMLMNGLVEIDENNQATPELLESWEAKPGAQEWTFKVRQGVTFHNGKALTVEDILYSINLHRGDQSRSAIKTQLAAIKDLKKSGENEITLTLDSGNADLPFLLADYHLVVVPDGFTDWKHPIGTGGFVFDQYQPGVRSYFKRNPNYWKPNRAFVDAVEVLVINDATARTNALISGQVHAINRVDFKTVDFLKRSPALNIVRAAGGQHFTFLMDCRVAPFNNNDVRTAIKYGIDREKLLATVLRGYGTLGNDHPIPKTDRFFNKSLEQRAYDPDKAKFFLKKAGLSALPLELSSSDAAFAGALDAAALFQGEAAAAGIQVSIKRQPADSYWDDVWMKAPFSMGYWGGRPTADQMFSTAWQSTAKWNDTHWKNDKFDSLLIQARSLLDDQKRAEIYGELQSIARDDGGAMIPLFGDYLDAASKKVGGVKPHPLFNFMGGRLAERVWLES